MEDATDKRPGRNIVHIIEDDESVRRAIARLMHSSGLETTAFSSAEEFLQTESPNAGCLIVDIQLPGMNGFDLEARLSSVASCLPIIFITAHHDPAVEQRARRVGALAYFRKPFEDEELLEAVQKGLPGGARKEESKDDHEDA